jgi:hypothetical protein
MNNVHPAGVQCTLMTILGNARFSPAHWLMFETSWIYYIFAIFYASFRFTEVIFPLYEAALTNK